MNFQLEPLPIASSPFNSIEHLWAAFRRNYNKRLVTLCSHRKCPKENVLRAVIESAMEDISHA
jgi:transposase